MNILVAFKVVPNLDMIPLIDWEPDAELKINTAYVPLEVNGVDESALELARRIGVRDDFPGTLTALTIGDENTERALNTLLALGFQHAVRVLPEGDLRFAPQVVAACIANYMRRSGMPDLVLTGGQSPEGDNAQTPLLLAEMLGWPCITNTVGLEAMPGGRVKVTSVTDEGILEQEAVLPLVVSVGDAPDTGLRVPTLKDRLRGKSKPVYCLPMRDLLPGDETPVETSRLVGLHQARHARNPMVVKGDTPAETARILYENHLKPLLDAE